MGGLVPITKEELLPLLQDPEVSRIIHDYADVDIGPDSLHHTIGPGSSQALQGDHTFDFSDFTQAHDIPSAPTGVNVTSAIETTQDGIKVVEATISWAPVTTNISGTTINADDLDSYLVSWSNAGQDNWSADFVVNPDQPVAYFLGFTVGQHIDVRVAAVNLAQNKSAYGYAFDVTLVEDTTPPNQPSKPIVTSLFGAIRAQWDGLDSVGAQMALDFDHVDVHVGNVSTFFPDDSNKIDSIPTLNGGSVVMSYTDYGVIHYVKFRAVDKTGNISSYSVPSDPVASRRGVDADFENLSATKITAGKLSVDVGLAGRLLIGPLNANGTLVSPLGARMELRNDGLHLYNSSNIEVGTLAVVSGVPTVNIQGPVIAGGTITGATVVGGMIETAISGSRVTIGLNPLNSMHEINFYSGDASEVYAGSLSGDVINSSGVKSGYVNLTSPDLGYGFSSIELHSKGSLGQSSVTYLTTDELKLGTIFAPSTAKISGVAGIIDEQFHPYPKWAGSTQRTIVGAIKVGNTDANGYITTVHSLPGTPIAVVATAAGSTWIVKASSWDNVNITFRCWDDKNTPSANAPVQIHWVAIA